MSMEMETQRAPAPPVSTGPSANGQANGRSLEGLHGTVALPPPSSGFWRQWRALLGPAFLLSLRYTAHGLGPTHPESRGTNSVILILPYGLSSYRAYSLLWTAADLLRYHR